MSWTRNSGALASDYDQCRHIVASSDATACAIREQYALGITGTTGNLFAETAPTAMDGNDDDHVLANSWHNSGYKLWYATVPSVGKGRNSSCASLHVSRWQSTTTGLAYVNGAMDSDRDGTHCPVCCRVALCKDI